MSAEGDNTVNNRVATHRSRLRNQGLKPMQVWLPDLSDSAVLEELEQACQDIENYPESVDDAAFAYAVAKD